MEWLSLPTIFGFVSSNWGWLGGLLVTYGIIKTPQTVLYKIGFKLGRIIRTVLFQRAGDEGGKAATSLYDIIHGVASGLKKT